MKKVAHKFLWGIIFLLLFTYCSSTLTIAHPVKAQDISTENTQETDFLWPSGPSVFADSAIVMEVTT